MTNQLDLKQQLQALCATQSLAVLSTDNQGQPYASLVAFACSDDLEQIVFATFRSTRKYANLAANKRVSMLIDNRSNKTTDFKNATATTVIGKAREIPKRRNSRLLRLYLAKHPHLSEFVESSDCALLSVFVHSYFVVNKFQQLQELHLRRTRSDSP